MICENCKQKNATSYCQVLIDGKHVQKYLCSNCRALLVKNDVEGNEFKIKKQFCRNCGTTLKDFIASSMVGCQYCYEEFSLVIEQALKSVQKKQMHIGKIPFRYQKKKDIEQVEHLINMAMENNDLMQVSRLTKRLKQLKGEIHD